MTDVRASSISSDGGRHVLSAPQHLLLLQSVDDDAYGEELQVVWEAEVGRTVLDHADLPSPLNGFDEPERLDAFLDAVRWGGASVADIRTLQSPFRSGIEVEDYQLDPLVRAIRMPRVNLLLADDVGLGKTIETGLVCQELILRHRARKVLVLCPSSLQVQWRDEMRDKFGLEFRIVDSKLLKELRRSRGIHANPWSHFPRLITSIDFLKRERPLRMFRETLPADGRPRYPRAYDLLIVDEAHNSAPSGRGRYATDSQRTQALRIVAPHFENRIFVTATPHNGYRESFTALLELLDNQRFARGVDPKPEHLAAVMVRRMKSELPPKWDGTPRFATRELVPLEVEFSEQERRAYDNLHEYTKLRLAGAGTATERYAAEFVLKLLKKRLVSSPAAFASTLEQHLETLRSPKSKRVAADDASMGWLREQVERTNEDFEDDDEQEDTIHDVVSAASSAFRPLSAEEDRLLRDLRTWAQQSKGRADSKAARLISWLHETVKPDGLWNDQRVIVFTEFRATQEYLRLLLSQERLAEGTGDQARMLLLYGGMPLDRREAVKAAFQASPADAPVRILLATDAASEGINLQNHCHRVVHESIPYSPTRLEQRNGRVDRHGQRAGQVLIYHFVSAGYQERLKSAGAVPVGALDADLEFLMRVAVKVNTIREDLGKVGPVIATQVEEAMLGKRRELQTAEAEREAGPIRAILTFQRNLDKQIAEFREQLDETKRTMHFTPDNIRHIVSIALQMANQPPLEAVPCSDSGTRDGTVFRMPHLTGGWRDCCYGLEHPHTKTIRPITFDHSVAEGRDDVVLVHLNHRLVQMSLRLLRSEVWSAEGRRRLHRVTARRVPDALLRDPAAIAHARIVVTGTDGHRLHEELIAAGVTLKEGQIQRMSADAVERMLDAALADAAPPAVGTRLGELWPRHERALQEALGAAMRSRAGRLQRTLEERAETEVKNVTAVLDELYRAIEKEMGRRASPQLQLDIYEDAQLDQWERDSRSLRTRWEEIPGEKQREAEAIRKRFAEPTPRLFPVAVTYLVPERIAREAVGGGR